MHHDSSWAVAAGHGFDRGEPRGSVSGEVTFAHCHSPVRALVAHQPQKTRGYFLAAVFWGRLVPSAGCVDLKRGVRNPHNRRVLRLFHRHPAVDLRLSLLFACDARAAKAHDGWPAAPRVFRVDAMLAQGRVPGPNPPPPNLIGVLCFDAIMVRATGTVLTPIWQLSCASSCWRALLTSRIYSIAQYCRRSQNRRNRLWPSFAATSTPSAGDPDYATP